MTKSLTGEVSVDIFSGGTLYELAVISEPCLSECVSIFWITTDFVMHATILILLL